MLAASFIAALGKLASRAPTLSAEILVTPPTLSAVVLAKPCPVGGGDGSGELVDEDGCPDCDAKLAQCLRRAEAADSCRSESDCRLQRVSCEKHRAAQMRANATAAVSPESGARSPPPTLPPGPQPLGAPPPSSSPPPGRPRRMPRGQRPADAPLPPPPPVAPDTCEDFCFTNAADWGPKCGWGSRECALCAECAGGVSAGRHSTCEGWCASNAASWSAKCNWASLTCDTCDECSLTSPSPPPSPPPPSPPPSRPPMRPRAGGRGKLP